jgi:hypothetical protein
MLMLSVGPLQAQILYACAQTEKASSLAIKKSDASKHNVSKHNVSKHNAELCNAHQSCVNIDCDNALNSSQGRCCEESATLTINPDLQQNIPAINVAEVESDVDPPHVISTIPGSFLLQQAFEISVVFPRINSGQSGSSTYLITHRLRI